MNKPILFSLQNCMKCTQTKELLEERNDIDIITYPHDINEWSDDELNQAKTYNVFDMVIFSSPASRFLLIHWCTRLSDISVS